MSDKPLSTSSQAATAIKLGEECDRLRAELAKAERFKAWVHSYLDDKGIPYHPPGVHGAEGCRIGDRMDFLFAGRDTLWACVRKLVGLLRPFGRYAAWLDAGQPGGIPDETPIIYPEQGYPDDHSEPTVGDCRQAAQAVNYVDEKISKGE